MKNSGFFTWRGKILLAMVICLQGFASVAQWSRTAPYTYLTFSTDNVGVGINAPRVKLDVVSPMAAQGTYDIQYWSDGSPVNILKLRQLWNNDGGINYYFAQRHNSTDYVALSFYRGNIGIGTTAPRAKLDVVSSMPGQGTYDVQTWSDGNPVQLFKLQQVWNNSGIMHKFVQRHANVEYPVLSFYAGNVGIGVENPATVDAKLAVRGRIHAQEVVIDLLGAAAPDYVFEKTYDLAPLSEVEAYILTHKHLPEIPAGSVLEQKGIELREMNLLLLKKVEELTLYLIEQQKTISAQEARLKALEAK